MCGIVGFYSQDRQLPEPQAFAQACREIAHRGPDDQGIETLGKVVLGHRRLSIIDLSQGHQPLSSSDEQIWVVFNGEIYNYVELQQELIGLGHRFRTASDTEVIVEAYKAWGTACFARFRGMFAIALWDCRTEKLVLARDPLGKKPLYWYGGAKACGFASELKSLKWLPGFSSAIDTDSVRDYLLMGYTLTPNSIYRSVNKLKPGHYLEIDQGQVRETRYYHLDFEPKHAQSEDELLDELDHILDESVRLRLRSDVPFGAFLSGGLDSSIVTALMARHLDQPVKTYSIGFEEREFSELSDARVIADLVGSDHQEHIVHADAVSLVDKLAWHCDEPFADSSAIPSYIVAQIAARDVKMVLTGDGGDEAFGGYERYFKYHTLARLHRASFGQGGQIACLAAPLLGARGKRVAWLGQRLRLPFPERYISGVALATPALADKLLLSSAQVSGYGERILDAFQFAYRDPMDSMIHGDIQSYLLDDILVKVDRMTMANSLEARSPLLDAELVKWSVRLPVTHKHNTQHGKLLLKKYAERLLPKQALAKKKQGFAIPMAQWFREDLREMTADLVGSQAFRERGVFDPVIAQGLFDAHVSGQKDHSEHLWQLLMFETWARQHLDASGATLTAA